MTTMQQRLYDALPDEDKRYLARIGAQSVLHKLFCQTCNNDTNNRVVVTQWKKVGNKLELRQISECATCKGRTTWTWAVDSGSTTETREI